MAELDEVSQMIGGISADIRNIGKWFDDHEKRDQERFEELQRSIAAISNTPIRVQKLEASLAKVEPVVNSIQRMSWTLGGFVTGLSFIGGAVGNHVFEAIKWVFSG